MKPVIVNFVKSTPRTYVLKSPTKSVFGVTDRNAPLIKFINNKAGKSLLFDLKDVLIKFEPSQFEGHGKRTTTVEISPEQTAAAEKWQTFLRENADGAAEVYNVAQQYGDKIQMKLKINEKCVFPEGLGEVDLNAGIRADFRVSALMWEANGRTGISFGLKEVLGLVTV